MASIRSNLNSVSSTSSLAAIKTRLSTCLKNWRSKTLSISLQPKEYTYWHQQYYQKNSHILQIFKEYPLKQKTGEHLEEFKKRLRKLFSNPETNEQVNQCSGIYSKKGQIHIVAQFLATSLIASATSNPSQGFRKQRSTTLEECFTERIKMTIVEDGWMIIRDEYPDLETELKGILVSRNQEGATIREIREDYLKMTGMPLPLFDNVADFLLSIPSVSAVCNENGTLIFNIKPSSKNKHIHDLVANQKPASNLKRILEESRDQNSYSWRHNLNYKKQRLEKSDRNILNYYDSLYSPYKEIEKEIPTSESQDMEPCEQSTVRQNSLSREEESQQMLPNDQVDVELIEPQNIPFRIDEEQCNFYPEMPMPLTENEFYNFNNNNGIYQDNVNYLQSRVYSQEFLPPPEYNVVDPNNNYYDNQRIFHQSNTELPSRQINNYNRLNPQKFPFHNNSKRYRRSGTPYPSLYLHRRSSSFYSKSVQSNESYETCESDFEAHYLDFPLLGDDFFLYLARMELKCKFRKNHGIYQSGLCVSGQTIRAAIERVRSIPYRLHKKVIVNIGSVDIMKGRALIKIEHDLKKLLSVMKEKNLCPILTTLAPLANYIHEPEVKDNLKRFNEFIKRQHYKYTVIDIWSILVNETGQTLYGCYQSEPRGVTGASEPYVFWNKIGRQRVLKHIESKLEY